MSDKKTYILQILDDNTITLVEYEELPVTGDVILMEKNGKDIPLNVLARYHKIYKRTSTATVYDTETTIILAKYHQI